MTAFRLASVLRLRRTLQEQCEVRAAAAHRAALSAADLAAHRHVQLRAARLASGDASNFLASVSARGTRAASALDADQAAAAAKFAHEARIGELIRASMAVSALERLEERTAEAARVEEGKREAREIDDLVTARFALRGLGS
jgi:CelD/BcsL family acetyltransferase involved in cellulose biosynthesis